MAVQKIPEHWGAPLGVDPVQRGAVDAVVVGSGAGGAPVALTLARAGYRVLVLEKGPAYNQSDFVYDEIRSCRRDFWVPTTADEPHTRLDSHGHSQRTTDGWTANCIGGGTTHFTGFSYRLHPDDLRLKALVGEVEGASVADWPIAWEELEPYYERAEMTVGVSGDAAKNPFEPKSRRPLPLPPLAENGFARLLDKACAELGLHPYPTARAILSRPWGGRSPCRRSFFCGSYGCETTAKSSTLAALIPQAVATGRCQVRPLSMVTRIESDAAGRATGVRYLDATGAAHKISAAVVVVACSAVESARLLLMSAGKQAHRGGLANGSGLVGRHLMFIGKGTGEAEFSAADPQVRAMSWREPFVNRSLQDFYVIDRGKPTVRKGGTIAWQLPHSNPIYTAEMAATRGRAAPLWGRALKDELRRLATVRRLAFEIFSETLPMHDSRVTLDRGVKDRFGLPVAQLGVSQHVVDREVNSILVDRSVEVLRKLDGKRIEVTLRGGQDHVLQCGTCRFGSDPKTSVLDRDCRAHDAPNLFVSDSSFMPTSGGVPPTTTIEANALRVADRIVALGKSHGLFKIGRR